MRYRPKPAISEVDADQWFPGKEVRGVMGAKQNMICGCVIIHGSDAHTPHAHTATCGPVPVEPGDWIVHSDGRIIVMKDAAFKAEYEPVVDEAPKDPGCVCCRQGHRHVKAKKGDWWCRACQQEGCPQPKLE